MPSSKVRRQVPLTRLPPWFPGQTGGVPGVDIDTGLRQDTNGRVFYVDPNFPGVSDQRDGTDPTSPLATVGAALTKCEAYHNDVIQVASSRYWRYDDPTSVQPLPIREEVIVTVPGVRIVGVMPSGVMGVPWLATANNGTCITINAMNVLVEGFNFWADTYTGVTGILSEWNGAPSLLWGDNPTIRHCFFGDGLSTGISLDYAWYTHIHDCWFYNLVVVGIDTPAAYGRPDYSTIENCDFVNCLAAVSLDATDHVMFEDNKIVGCPTGIELVSGDEWVIKNNVINTGGAGTVAISAEGSNECVIDDNVILGNPAGADNMIDLTNGANNMVSDNSLSCTVAQYDTTCSDAGSGFWVNNHCTDGNPAAPPT